RSREDRNPPETGVGPLRLGPGAEATPMGRVLDPLAGPFQAPGGRPRKRTRLNHRPARTSSPLNPHSPGLFLRGDESSRLVRIVTVMVPRRGLLVTFSSFLLAGSLASCGGSIGDAFNRSD